MVRRYRVVEHVITPLNRFQALRQRRRSPFGRHTQVGRVIAVLVDRRIAVTPLKVYAAAT